VTIAKNIRIQTCKLFMKCELELVCISNNIFLVKTDNYLLINQLTQTTSKDLTATTRLIQVVALYVGLLSAAHAFDL